MSSVITVQPFLVLFSWAVQARTPRMILPTAARLRHLENPGQNSEGIHPSSTHHILRMPTPRL